MSFANGTTHFGLPQTVGTDKRDWFDTNEPFRAIDEALYSAKTTADQGAEDISALNTRVGTVEGDVTSLTTRVGTAEGDISALQGGQTTLGNNIADVKADLSDAICAIKEADATADYAHAVDSYFWYNDTLYITTQAIAVGDTIVPNTNCNTTNVTTEIIKALTQSTSEIDDSTTSASKTWSSQKVSGELTNKQNASDNSLTTTDKTVIGAINEINSELSDKADTSALPSFTKGSITSVAVAGNSDGNVTINGSFKMLIPYGYGQTSDLNTQLHFTDITIGQTSSKIFFHTEGSASQSYVIQYIAVS